MEAHLTRLFQPATVLSAIVVATLIVFVIGLALGVAFTGSQDVEPLLGPFRWPSQGPSTA